MYRMCARAVVLRPLKLEQGMQFKELSGVIFGLWNFHLNDLRCTKRMSMNEIIQLLMYVQSTSLKNFNSSLNLIYALNFDT